MKFPLPKEVTTYTDTPILFTAAQTGLVLLASWAIKKGFKKLVGIEETTVKYKPKA